MTRRPRNKRRSVPGRQPASSSSGANIPIVLPLGGQVRLAQQKSALSPSEGWTILNAEDLVKFISFGRLRTPAMQYLVALLIIFLTLVGGATYFVDIPDAVTRHGLIEQHERIDDRKEEDEVRAPTGRQATTEQVAPGLFDIAKIAPDGTSVFAGRSTPNTVVTVLADGGPIGTANTDENGEWVLITDRHFPNPNLKLSIQVGTPVQRSPPSRVMGNSGSDVPSAASVSAHLMDGLRLRVERARADAERRTAAKTEIMTDAAQPHEMVSDRPVSETLVATSGENPTVATGENVLPVPIKFVFREAGFTDDGRKAAQLLLDYLLLKQPPSLRMTGHADERGTHDFNMNLSAERLETVSTFLRAGGYAGQVELIPKGDAEPFKGVDRTLVPRDELYDLDRRVELQITE